MCWKRNKKEKEGQKAEPITVSTVRRPLMPKILGKSDISYHCVEELKYVIEQTNCRNIALTGVYGSGKSSVIETYLNEQSFCKKPLKISLSTFLDDKVFFDKEEEKLDNKRYNADVEYKIVQHILYKSDPHELHQSRFDRITHKTNKGIKWLSFWVLLAVVAAVVLFEPGFLRVENLHALYWKWFGVKAGAVISVVADIASASYLILFLGCLIYKVLIHYYPGRISKVKAQGVEVELSKNSSVFNQLLDEIVYFFNANRYDIVVFEDLDRLQNPDILFLKLRELNMLLNESETFRKNKLVVRFVYAIRDDVFTKDLRTKCFDYIIPVAPVIDHFNTSDYLIQHKNELFNKIDDKDLKELGVWISGFRELNNILNEYTLYKKLVMKEGMADKKLLAIIIYKNLYPQDFASLHSKSGLLYMLYHDKARFTEPFTKDGLEKVKELDNKIKADKENIQKIKKEYVDYIIREHNVSELLYGDERYPVEELVTSDTLFDHFRKNDFTQYIYVDTYNKESGTVSYKIKFVDIEEEIGQGLSYDEAVYPHISSINSNTVESDKVKRSIKRIESQSLTTLFLKSDGVTNNKRIKEITTESDDEKISFMQAMIRGGYIMEDYPTYISYYHKGALLEGDFSFLNNVRQGIAKPYDTHLQNPELIIKQLVTDNFSDPSILNFSMLKCLMKRKELAHLLDKFIETARTKPEFIVEYSKSVEDPYSFLALVFTRWDSPIDTINAIDEEWLRNDMLLLYYYTSGIDARLQNKEIDFIKSNYAFINQNIKRLNIERLKHFLNTHKIKFNTLAPASDAAQNALLDCVRESSMFYINYQNLRIVLGKDFDRQSYSSVYKLQNKNLKEYLLDKNIDEFIRAIPDSSTEEEYEPLLDLINHRAIEDKWLSAYLVKQNIMFETFEGIVDKRQYILLNFDKIVATWENIVDYYKFHPTFDEVLSAFIGKHAEDLKRSICEGEPSIVEQLKKHLFCKETSLSLENFESLLSSFNGPLMSEDLSELGEERILKLIEQKWIYYSAEALSYINENYSEECFASFVIKYFDEIFNDEEVDWSVFNSNQLGIKLLESNLSLDQKISFVDSFATIDTSSNDASRLAELICFYYVKAGMITADTDQDLLLRALEFNKKPESWKSKITLVNMMNDYYSYNREKEKRMVSSLGGEMYQRLNYPGGRAHFDINNENKKLLKYLKEQGHYVKDINESKGQLQVSFKMKE